MIHVAPQPLIGPKQTGMYSSKNFDAFRFSPLVRTSSALDSIVGKRCINATALLLLEASNFHLEIHTQIPGAAGSQPEAQLRGHKFSSKITSKCTK